VSLAVDVTAKAYLQGANDMLKSILEKIINNRHYICLSSRQSGKTTLASAYILWYVLFNSDKVIGIVSNKEKSAKDILKRLKGMYEEVPY
jgi:phage terminase large subunit-like protein